eukprot:1036235-Pyramimonas_sp.AAC.1
MRTLPLAPSVGPPCGATGLVMVVPKWPEAAMRPLPLRPPDELPWRHDSRDGCAEMARGCNENLADEAFGEAPCGARSLLVGAPKWPEANMRTLPMRPSVDPTAGPRSS